VSEGFVPVTGGKVWYKAVGSGSRIPLLLLHGGPGFSCMGMEALEALADDRPVIFYDQLGAGRSERPADPSLWTTARFVEELAQIRQALDLDQVHLLGHSWGTMLAAEYLLTEPRGVKSVVMSSPCLSVSRWAADLDEYRRAMPADVRAVLDRCEAEGTTSSVEYRAASMEFYKRHLCRLDPWPDTLWKAFESMNPAIYNTMWGPSEFRSTGTLRTFERAEDLRGLSQPMLFLCGRYDEAAPGTTEYYRNQAPVAELLVFENSAHVPMLEEPALYVESVRHFLRRVDSGST
jgi:proline-specific peptidase